jgi:predicted TIM-barrel fold metal-dependent hydrolase
MNDHLAAAIARQPDRFAGFAALPTRSPRLALPSWCARSKSCISQAR